MGNQQNLCSDGSTYDPWIDRHQQQAKQAALSKAASDSILQQGKALQKEAKKEFAQEDGKAVMQIEQQEHILMRLIGQLKKNVEEECGVQNFQRKTGKDMGQYFKEGQLKEAFKSFKEQAQNEFQTKQQFMLKSIQKQTEKYAEQVQAKGNSQTLAKERPEIQQLIMKRCLYRYKDDIQKSNSKAIKDFRQDMSIELLSKNLSSLETAKQSGEFFQKTLESYKASVTKVLQSLQNK